MKLKIMIFLAISLILIIACGTKSKDTSLLVTGKNEKRTDIMNENVETDVAENNQRELILQTVIDMSALQSYFHVDEDTNRKPLYVEKNSVIAKNLKLNKFGEPVKFASCDEIKKLGKPYLEFTKFDLKGDKAKVVFRYRVEGLEGTVNLSKTGDSWSVDNQKIDEVKFEDAGCV